MAEITKQEVVYINDKYIKQLDEIIVQYKKDTEIDVNRSDMLVHIIETIHTIILATPICL